MSLIFSSLLSLVVGAVVGLTQKRIKRLFAFSTISHIGFILLSLCIHSIESIQAFIFYLMQYSISNLNAFFLLIAIGYSLYFYIKRIDKYETGNSAGKNTNLQDINNSPIQLISQLKGYYYINPMLALSLSITLFSFIGVPPLIGFFGKQMVLSSALDNGYVFMSLVAILTSVISAVYYLVIIKEVFFDKPEYTVYCMVKHILIKGLIVEKNKIVEKVEIRLRNFVISSSLSLPISILTLIIGLFILMPQE